MLDKVFKVKFGKIICTKLLFNEQTEVNVEKFDEIFKFMK